MIRHFALSLMIALQLVTSSLQGGLTLSTLGNSSPGFADGSTPSLLDLLDAQNGQPSPFDAGVGHELLGDDASGEWSHSYGASAETIVGAIFRMGIADHDSQASGSQLASFTIDGVDLTTTLDGLFEASGGSSSEYNVYSFTLPPSIFSSLADGTANVSIALAGPGLETNLLEGGVEETEYNAAHFIFSTLAIRTVPEPSPFVLFCLLGVLGIAYTRFRV